MCSDNVPSVYIFKNLNQYIIICIYFKFFGNYVSIHRYVVHLGVHLHNIYFIPVYGNIAIEKVCAK